MPHFTFPKRRVRTLGALTAAVAAATVLGTAASASASLSSDNWTAVTLPAGYFISNHTGVAPVSCVPHTQFCIVAVNDSAAIRGPGWAGDAILVTSDGGQTWTGYNSLPTAFYEAISISCSSTSVCGVAGEDIHGEPQVAFTTDGGKTWTDPTPADWENVDWIATSIDCVPASGCWLTGLNGPFGNFVYPILLKTWNLGASWQNFSNLPGSRTTNPATSYGLQDISCVSAAWCVAVSTADGGNSIASVLATTNGGLTWTRFPVAKINQFGSVSCVPGIGLPTCFATATTYNPQAAGDSVIVTSRTSGLSWNVDQDFGAQAAQFVSISCTDASHCWADGDTYYQPQALDGTADGGRSWSLVTSSQANTGGAGISCLSVSVCVATTDNALWVTSDDGGLTG